MLIPLAIHICLHLHCGVCMQCVQGRRGGVQDVVSSSSSNWCSDGGVVCHGRQVDMWSSDWWWQATHCPLQQEQPQGHNTPSLHTHTGWRKKTGPPCLIANILKIPWPNCVEIGELLQYYMLNTVINFLFKNFIALWWRHLAKTQLLCDAQIYLYNVNKRQ